MTRKIISLMLALVLLVALSVPALAQDNVSVSATVRSAYWTEGMLYAFADFPQADAPEELEVSLMRNFQVVSGTKPVLMKNSAARSRYLFLVDNSVSMGQYRDQMFAVVREFMNGSADNVSFSVALFDRSFQMAGTSLKDWSSVRAAMWKSTNNVEETDICGAVAWALEELAKDPGAAGDLTGIVLLTDGHSMFTGAQAAEKKKEAAQNAAAMLSAYPEITLHTVCFDSWDTDVKAALSSARGMDLHAGSKKAATEAGEELAAYLDRLCCMSYRLGGYDDAAVITDDLTLCVGINLSSIGSGRNVAMAPAIVPVDIPEEPETPADGTEPTEATEPTEGETVPGDETEPTEGETVPDDGTEPTEEGTEPTEGTEEPLVPAPGDGSGTGSEGETEAVDAVTEETGAPCEESEDSQGMAGWLIAVIVAGVLVALAVVFLVVKKCSAPKDSVRMRIDVLSGNVVKLKKDYYLTTQLLIGTDKRCDVVIEDPGAGSVNTRIFKQGQMIYIEDMDSPGGTLLGGMRLYSSNRLRSGDDITIGTVTLRILF